MSNFSWSRARLLLPVLLMVFSQAAFALGLGNIKVESFLNQPLNARIDLLVRPGEDITGITAKLASADDYALIGASRDSISVPLRFVVQTQEDQAYIQVTSTLPVNDPVVRLIVELNWASGRLLREYTLFLDPPTVPSQAPPPVVDQRRSTQATPPPAVVSEPLAEPQAAVETAVEEGAEDATGTDAAVDQSSAGSTPRQSGAGEYGPVQSGDTLWRIASNWSDGSNVSVNQVMLAIQRSNPQAFINNNINLIKRGAILRMPSAEDIAAISATAAREEVLEQAELFAGVTAAAPAPQAEVVAPAVETPLVDVASEMSSDNSSSEPDMDSGHLEIVPPSEESAADSAYGAEDSAENTSASTSVVSLQEELARKEEALITEQQTNEYLQQRIRELESQASESESQAAQIVVEDEGLADMESRLREQREAAAEPPAAAAVETSPAAEGQPWYSRVTIWVIAALVLVAAGFGWLRSRRSGENFDLAAGMTNAEDSTVRGIKDDAEEILKVLKPVEPLVKTAPAGGANAASDTPQSAEIYDNGDDAYSVEDGDLKPANSSGSARRMDHDHEEAYLLDEDSADPEVRLDLARAYISMGDREAARAILGEVIEHGDEAQRAEAKSMLGGL